MRHQTHKAYNANLFENTNSVSVELPVVEKGAVPVVETGADPVVETGTDPVVETGTDPAPEAIVPTQSGMDIRKATRIKERIQARILQRQNGS